MHRSAADEQRLGLAVSVRTRILLLTLTTLVAIGSWGLLGAAGPARAGKESQGVEPQAASSPTETPSPAARAGRPAAPRLDVPPTASSSSSASSGAPSPTAGPRSVYLALGDSLAFGQQADGGWGKGSTDVLTDWLRDVSPQLQQVNLGCPGETSTTFASGGCPYQHDTRTPYTGPQLAAALAQVSRTPDLVSPVTVQLGLNDLLPLIDPGTRYADGSCLVHAWTSAAAGFRASLRAAVLPVKDALAGRGDLLLLNVYDPYEASCSNTGAVVDGFNAQIDAVAGELSLRVADVRGALRGTTCTTTGYTVGCAGVAVPTRDIHPSSSGYRAIAAAVQRAYG